MVVGIPPGPVVFGATALEGATETGERMVTVTIEQPEPVRGFDGEVSQHVLERLHLERYRADHLLRRGEVPFDSVRRGEDPPDFVVSSEPGEVQLDCAVIAREERRNAHRLFGILQGRLTAGAEGRDFSGIAGTSVSVWFGERMDKLPPRRSDDSVVDPLLDALAATKVDHQAHKALMDEIARAGFPAVLPPVFAEGKTPEGTAGFIANIICGPEQASQLPGGRGFITQLHMPSAVTITEMKTVLDQVVAGHDKPAIEHLLITAGGPDKRGIRYPAEEIFAALIAQEPGVTVAAQHIRQVTLHLWSACEIVDIPVTPAEQSTRLS